MKHKTTIDLWGLPILERGIPKKIRNITRNKSTSKAWYLRNREKVLEQCKAWVKANRARVNANQNAWVKANRNKINAYRKNWARENRDKIAIYQKTWRTENPQKYKAGRLKRKYNLSLEQFNKLLEAQGGKCGICGTKEFGKFGPQLDHCGKAGHVRGILCRPCNIAIGFMQHSPRILAAAQKYLSREELFNQS